MKLKYTNTIQNLEYKKGRSPIKRFSPQNVTVIDFFASKHPIVFTPVYNEKGELAEAKPSFLLRRCYYNMKR